MREVTWSQEYERLAESAIAADAVQLRTMLETLPAGAYTCDPDGLITYYNQHAVQLWGRAPKLNDPSDRFCGSFKLFTTDGTAIKHDQCWMALALRGGRGYNAQEILVQRPDGQRLTVLAPIPFMMSWAGSWALSTSWWTSEPFDVVISDIGLPDATGYELMSEIRARYGMKGIALSGYGTEEDIQRSRNAGFVEHVAKPVNFAQLQAVIQRLCIVE